MDINSSISRAINSNWPGDSNIKVNVVQCKLLSAASHGLPPASTPTRKHMDRVLSRQVANLLLKKFGIVEFASHKYQLT
jgi:hypothetical protein